MGKNTIFLGRTSHDAPVTVKWEMFALWKSLWSTDISKKYENICLCKFMQL